HPPPPPPPPPPARPTDLGADLEFDPGIKFGAAYGLIFGSTRLEVELSYAKSGVDKWNGASDPYYLTIDGTLEHITMMFNGYYDFMKDSVFQPFVTAGVGYSRAAWDFNIATNVPDPELHAAIPIYNRYLKDNDAGYCFQVGAGIAYELTDTLTMDLKYRYFGGDVPDDASHNVLLGVRFMF
ncbi:MAG: outer membrane beta-barrel protein, partial [Desulfobacteraceae bacterium]